MRLLSVGAPNCGSATNHRSLTNGPQAHDGLE